MRTRDAFDRTTARLLAQRVKKKFTNPEEDIANVRVMANGVAATGGQVYNADVAGHRPGTVIKAVNVGSKAKAHYVAQYGNSDGNGLLGENDVKRMIAAALEGFSQNEIKQIATTPTEVGGATPQMTVTPSYGLEAFFTEGENAYTDQTYTLENTGTVSIDWKVLWGSEWLIADVGSGTLGVGETVDVTITVSEDYAPYLAGGEYTDIILFSTQSSVAAARNAVLHITPVVNPRITVTPDEDTIAYGDAGTDLSTSKNYTVTSVYSGTIFVTVMNSKPWVTVSPEAFYLAASGSQVVTVSVNSASTSFVEGKYLDVVQFGTTVL